MTKPGNSRDVPCTLLTVTACSMTAYCHLSDMVAAHYLYHPTDTGISEYSSSFLISDFLGASPGVQDKELHADTDHLFQATSHKCSILLHYIVTTSVQKPRSTEEVLPLPQAHLYKFRQK